MRKLAHHALPKNYYNFRANCFSKLFLHKLQHHAAQTLSFKKQISEQIFYKVQANLNKLLSRLFANFLRTFLYNFYVNCGIMQHIYNSCAYIFRKPLLCKLLNHAAPTYFWNIHITHNVIYLYYLKIYVK